MINRYSCSGGSGGSGSVVIKVVIVNDNDRFLVLLPVPWNHYGGVLTEFMKVDEK